MTDMLNTTTGGDIIDHRAEHVRRVTTGWLIGQRSPHTRRAYQQAVRGWVAWCLEHDVDPVDPDRQHVQAWLTHLRQGLGQAPATVRQRASAIKAWHAELALEGVRPDRDVHRSVKLPPAPAVSHTKLLTDTEVAALLAAARVLPTPAETALAMMATMGLRASEAGIVHAGMLSSSPWGTVVNLTGKGDKAATLPAPAVVLAAADRHGWPGTDAVGWSERRVYQRLVRWCARAADDAGIAGFHCHMLRHWFVTRALQLGVSERHVQASARHADFDTTQRYNRAADVLEHHATHTVGAHVAGIITAP